MLGVSVSHIAYDEDTAHLVVTEEMLNGHNSAHYDIAVTRDGDGQLRAEMRGHSREIAKLPVESS